MNHFVTEREYPYRHRLLGTSLVFLLGGSMAVFGLWNALTDQRDIIINGIIPLRGGAASIFRWACFAIMALCSVVIGWFLWIRVAYPCQRIAFTASGILLPRSRWATMEEFVEYGEIRDVALEQLNGLWSSEVTRLRFRCVKGTFSISRQKLNKDDFEEVCAMLLQKCNEANCSPSGRRDIPPIDQTR